MHISKRFCWKQNLTNRKAELEQEIKLGLGAWTELKIEFNREAESEQEIKFGLGAGTELKIGLNLREIRGYLQTLSNRTCIRKGKGRSPRMEEIRGQGYCRVSRELMEATSTNSTSC